MWTAKDFMDTPTKDTKQANQSTKGKWTASDFTNTNVKNEPSQSNVVASNPNNAVMSINKPSNNLLQPLQNTTRKMINTPKVKYASETVNKTPAITQFIGRMNRAAIGEHEETFDINPAANTAADALGGAISIMGNPSLGVDALNELGSKAGQKVLSKITAKLGTKTGAKIAANVGRIATESAITNAPISAVQGASEGMSNKDIAKKVALDTAGGMLIQGGTEGLGYGLNKAVNKAISSIRKYKISKTPTDVLLNKMDYVPKQLALPAGKEVTKPTLKLQKPLKDTTIQLPPINPASKLPKGINAEQFKANKLNDLYNQYNTAIETIQNKFGTNSLRADEVSKIKTELGIDLDKIIDEMSYYENVPTKELQNKLNTENKFKLVSGLGDENTYKTMAEVKKYNEALNNLANKNVQSRFKPQTKLSDINSNPTIKLNQNTAIDTPYKVLPGELPNKSLLKEIPSIKTNNPVFPEPSSKIVSSKNSSKTTLGQKINKAYTKIVDNQHPLSEFSKVAKDNTHIIASNTRNAGGTVDYIIKDALVDRNGNHIGESLQNIIKDIPKDKEEKFWEYALHKHNVARAGQNKPVYTNYTPEMSTQVYKQLEQQHPEFAQVSQRLNDYLKKFTKAWGVDAGTVDKALMDSLHEIYPNYIPTNRAFSDLERGNLNANKKGFVNQKAPIKKATGSSRNIINPTESIMNMINKTVRSAKYNEVGQSLLNSLRNNPEGLRQFAEIIPTNQDIVNNINKTLQDEGIDGLTNHIADQFDEVASKGHLKGNNIVTVMDKGQPVQIKINNKDLLDSLTGLNKSNIGPIEKLGRKLTTPFKAVITTKNPLFAVKNVARDLPTAYINGSENNPLKFAKNYGKAVKDILTDGDSYKRYKAVGGGGSNFFSADKVSDVATNLTKNKGILSKAGDFIENLNNATETAPRLAEFEKVYNDTGDINKALNAANEVTTNFARGGSVTKTVDTWVPYLNASVQGLDKLGRQFINKPLQTLAKGAISITAPSIAFYMLNKNDPNYQNLDNRTKDNNYLIPKGDGTFIKIPKSRELGVLFGSLFERLSRQANGENNPFKNFGTTVSTNISPTNPVENNILTPLTLNLASNKDFANRPIVPTNLQKLSPKYQYDEKTSEIAKKIGEIANLSPKQIDYIIKSYTGVIGQIGLPMATKNGNPVKSVTSQFTADPLYNNEALNDFYNNLDKLDTKATDRNFVEKIPSKIVTPEERLRNQFTKASKQLSDISKVIKQLQSQDPVGNEDQIRKYQQLKLDIANKMNSMLK